MSVVYEIPTSNQPQTQTISLGGIFYKLTTRWNAFSQSWIGDLFDTNNNPILNGFPLVTGSNLLAQYGYLNIASGGAMLVQSDNDPNLVPDDITLGSTGHLFFVAP